ncbi:MAG: HAMP domain-containing protein [bacterium]|nr:HAMP domain-containing protein [bacterium]
MIPGRGDPSAMPLRLKLTLLLVAPLLVAGAFRLAAPGARLGLGSAPDLAAREERLTAFFTQLLEDAADGADAALVAEHLASWSPDPAQPLASRFEGAGVTDGGFDYVDWTGNPIVAPGDTGDPRAPRWRIYVDGVQTRLVVLSGPAPDGRSSVVSFVIDAQLEAGEFSRLLPRRLHRDVHLDIAFLDSTVDPGLPASPPDHDGAREFLLTAPSGHPLASARLEPIPLERRAGRARRKGRGAALLVFALLVAALFRWSRLVERPAGLVAALGALVGLRWLLAAARAPAELLPRSIGTASLYGTSELWRLMASPADLLLTALTLFLACVALRRFASPSAARRRAPSLLIAVSGALFALWFATRLTASIVADSRVPVFERSAVFALDAGTVPAVALALTLLAAAECAAQLWALLRSGDEQRSAVPSRVTVSATFVVLALAATLYHQRLDERMIVERLTSELAPQVLEQSTRRSRALTSALDRIAASYAEDPDGLAPRSSGESFLAWDSWSRGDLSQGGYKSSLEFFNADGLPVSYFGFDVPRLEDLDTDAPELETRVVEEELTRGVDKSQRLLHASRTVEGPGGVLGTVVGHVLDEPNNLPFLPGSQPYLTALGSSSARLLGHDLAGGVHYVLYDASGALQLSSLSQPPAFGPALRDAETIEPLRTLAGDEPLIGIVMPEAGRTHLLLAESRGLLERLADAVRVALLGLIVFGAISLAPRIVARGGALSLLRTVRRSFRRKLLFSVVLASAVPLIGLALILQGYVERRSEAALVDTATRVVRAAQRVLEDYSSVNVDGADEVQLDDNVLFWLSDIVGQEIHVYDRGRLLASSKRELFTSGLLTLQLDRAVFDGLSGGGEAFMVVRRTLGPTSVPVVYARLRSGDGDSRLVVAVPMVLEQLQIARAASRIADLILLTTVSLVGLLSLAAATLARTVARPVRELVEATARIASGDYATRLVPRTRDEVAQLVGAFNTMASSLASQRADLERRRDYMERLLQHATTGVISTDPAGAIVTLNPAATILLGSLGVELAPGRDLVAALDAGQPALARVVATPPHSPGEPEEIDLACDGEVLRLRVVRIDLPDPTADLAGTLILLDDVTQLMRSNQLAAWAEMARAIAHEIKNPLTPIQLSAEHLRRLLADRGVLPAPQIEACLETVSKQVRSLYEIAGEFSAFAKTPTLAPLPLDPVEFMRRTIEPYRAAPPPGIAVEEQYEPSPEAAIDERVLSRAVVNLVENAIQAMPEGGRLISRVGPSAEGGVLVEVRDTGVGLEPEVRGRLFEMYFSTKSSGTGLGLAIVRRAVEAHGGSIEVESEPGSGTSFRLCLPAI